MTRALLVTVSVLLGACHAELPTRPMINVQSQARTSSSKRRAVPPTVAIGAQCSNPAPYLASPERAPGYIVVYKPGVDAVAATARLSAKYNFTPRHVYTVALSGFASMLSNQAVAGLRCEPEVSYIEEDAYGHPAA